MSASQDNVMRGGLGPLSGAAPGTPVSTKPATTAGIFNNTVGAAAALVFQGTPNSSAQKTRRFKLASPKAGVNIGYTWVKAGTAAPTLTAVGDGTATDGSLVMGGSVSEWFNLDDDVDLYLAASAAATPYQIHVVDQV